MGKIFGLNLFSILFLSIILIILLFYVYQISTLIKNEQRIKKFAINGENTTNISLIDDLLNVFWRTIRFISRTAEKSVFLKRYAQKLYKYIIFNKGSTLRDIDYISIKILCTYVIQMLYAIVIIVRNANFNFGAFILSSLIAFFATDIVIYIIYRKKIQLMEEQLLQAVVIMNSAFKSGKTIRQAIDIVRRELPNPIRNEFETVEQDLNFGLDLETVFTRFAGRVKVEEAGYITSSLSLLNKTGGNIITVFNMIENNFYERLKIKNELSALTASSKFMYRVLLILPIIFIMVIVCLNPTYFSPLLTTTIGRLVSGVIFTLYVIYIFVIKKAMKVDKV